MPRERRMEGRKEGAMGAQRSCVLGGGPMVNWPELTIITTTTITIITTTIIVVLIIVIVILYMQTTYHDHLVGVHGRSFHIHIYHMIWWSCDQGMWRIFANLAAIA